MATLPLVAVMFTPAAADTDPLDAHRWKDRVLLVVASDIGDARVRQQREIFALMGTDARERDLTLVEVLGNTARAKLLRQRFGLDAAFHALLIGKDGGAKLQAEVPLWPESLMPLIDAMPMRQEEMRRRP